MLRYFWLQIQMADASRFTGPLQESAWYALIERITVAEVDMRERGFRHRIRLEDLDTAHRTEEPDH